MRVLSTLVRGLEMPVNEFPCSARGSWPISCQWSSSCICLLHVQQNCTVLKYCRYIKNDDHHERTTVEIPFKIKDKGCTVR